VCNRFVRFSTESNKGFSKYSHEYLWPIKVMGISLSSHRLLALTESFFFFPHTIHKTHKYLCCSLATACFLFWSLKGLYNSWCSFDMSPCLIFYEKQPGGSRCCFFTFLGYDRSAPPSLSLALTHSYYHHITLNMAPRNRYKVGRNMLNYKTLYRYVGYYKFIL